MLLLTLWDRRVQRAALRQLGMSYEQELWALLGDAAMLTFLALLFGTIGGLVYGWGNTLAGPVLFSMSPSFVVPWGSIGMAAVVAAVVCFVGALLPIVTGKRFDTLAALRCD
jgi:putative ABC transport system permease protein